MIDLPIPVLIGSLVVLIVISGCFSGSETALMAVNRYRLRHRARQGDRGARLVMRLLDQPDRLIGLILLGNNFVNVLASMLATVVALQIWDESALGATAIILTMVILIFAEVAPKTFAAMRAEKVAVPFAFIYTPLLRALSPVVWVVNFLANGLLRVLGIRPSREDDSLSADELRTVVNEAGELIPKSHQEMLVNILDLERTSVNDIMVPRNEIQGIDLNAEWDHIVTLLENPTNSRLPVYRESVDQVVGFLFLRDLIGHELRALGCEGLEAVIRPPYFVPEGTALTRQLVNFQRHLRRIGLVVDEYGDILGLVTLEDILEEIVGEFTTAPIPSSRAIHPQEDGSFICSGGTHLRELDRLLSWDLHRHGPKTLNGLILEYMEAIPECGTTFLIEDHPVEIVQTRENAVGSVRIHRRLTSRGRRAPGVAELPVQHSVQE